MPWRRLEEPWQDWVVVVREMDCAELIVTAARLVLLDPSVTGWGDAAHHAVAHLELGHHHRRGPLSDDDEAWARQLAWTLSRDEDEAIAS